MGSVFFIHPVDIDMDMDIDIENPKLMHYSCHVTYFIEFVS